ncbi:MAG: hypothetical protein EBS41_07370 [Actinobacteria bacterium]|nr:hypothetical protein [Actinomycetota bacterium]
MMLGSLAGAAKAGTLDAWQTHQIYIALGQFMTAAALLGVDTCPMEGIDRAKYDEVLGLAGSDYTTVVASRVVNADSSTTLARVVGKHCESGDIVVRDAMLSADISPGELLAVAATGAYCHSLASNYNHIVRPAVVAVSDGSPELLIRRETIGDILSRDAQAGE